MAEGALRRTITITSSCQLAARDESDADDVEMEGNRRGRRGRPARPQISMDDIRSEPMVYLFARREPDESACRLSDATKEEIWKRHQEDPVEWSVPRIAEHYRIRQQRAHAILWLKDVEREQEKVTGGKMNDELEKHFEELHTYALRRAGGSGFRVLAFQGL